MNVLKEYPAPWKLVRVEFGAWIEDSGGKTIVTMRAKIFDFEVLEFIVETVNNSARPRITDAKCECGCGWQGIVWDCLADIDGDGGLGCPICSKYIEVLA